MTPNTDGIVTPQYYDLMDRVSQRKSFKVIALKLLVTLSVYGPLTNGCVVAAVCRAGAAHVGRVGFDGGWIVASVLQSPHLEANIHAWDIPHHHHHKHPNPKRTTALSSPPCPSSKRAWGPSTPPSGCSSSRKSRSGMSSCGPSSTPSISRVSGFAWLGAAWRGVACCAVFLVCVCVSVVARPLLGNLPSQPLSHTHTYNPNTQPQTNKKQSSPATSARCSTT
jgi:hypothetical protein